MSIRHHARMKTPIAIVASAGTISVVCDQDARTATITVTTVNANARPARTAAARTSSGSRLRRRRAIATPCRMRTRPVLPRLPQ
ncbi:hypothetical protein ACFYS8_33070 [Kitasatospora sp. NPDC004615]|uniref:hypothetical protein n=1 Tax=unclassified Kitasatospora TaxID=2633591 RepID=UPI003696BF52